MKLFIGDCLSALPWFIGALTVRAVSVAAPLIQKPSMKTSDGQRTKAHDAQLIKDIRAHQRIIDKVCHVFCRNRADRQDLYQDQPSLSLENRSLMISTNEVLKSLLKKLKSIYFIHSDSAFSIFLKIFICCFLSSF